MFNLPVLPFQPFTFPMLAGFAWYSGLLAHQLPTRFAHQIYVTGKLKEESTPDG
jgi:hypothetical protein